MKLYISKILVTLLCCFIVGALWYDKLKNIDSDDKKLEKSELNILVQDSKIKIDNNIAEDSDSPSKTQDSLANKIKDYVEFVDKLEEVKFLVSSSNFIEANIIFEQILTKSYAKAKLEELIKINNKIKEASELKPEQIFPQNNFFLIWIEDFFRIEKYNKSQNQKNIEEILFTILQLKEYYYETKNLETMLEVL